MSSIPQYMFKRFLIKQNIWVTRLCRRHVSRILKQLSLLSHSAETEAEICRLLSSCAAFLYESPSFHQRSKHGLNWKLQHCELVIAVFF